MTWRLAQLVARSLTAVVFVVLAVGGAQAQPIGTFSWQLQPFCNVVTVNVTQLGAVYTFDGFDNQCGGARAPLVGTATFNPDGTIGVGLSIVTTPSGAPIHVTATLVLPGVSGTWSDSAGNSGAFVLSGAAGGSPRPLTVSGDVTSVSAGAGLSGGGAAGDVTLAVNPAAVQSRVTGVCPSGQLMIGVNQNGTVTCQSVTAAGGGDITSVNTPAGSGLVGGAASGDVSLSVLFGGTGGAAAAARSDHTHAYTHAADMTNSSTGVGFQALLNSTGLWATAVGSNALRNNTGSGNTAVGIDALFFGTSGAYNTALGAFTLGFTTTGLFNTAVGADALSANKTGSRNTAVGARASMRNDSGNDNVAVGSEVLVDNKANNNTAVGARAMFLNTTGARNSTLGRLTLTANTLGSDNVAVGYEALRANISGGQNVAVGGGALRANTIGIHNLAVGESTLRNAVTASRNTAVGQSALNVATSNDNTAVGAFALTSSTTGTTNTAIGARALGTLTTGSGNVALGYDAGITLTTGTNNIYVGHAGVAEESATIRLGSGVHTKVFLAGTIGVTTDQNNAVPVVIDGAGQLGTINSSRTTKNNIEDLGLASRAIFSLRPVRFTYKQPFGDGSTPVQYGLIAEEVAEVLPELVAFTSEGQPQTVKYHVLPTLLVAEVQRLEKERDAMAKEHAEMKRELAALRAVVESLTRQ